MTLLGAWGFGEGSGTTTADASGNGRTLTLNNASWSASGHTGSAIENTAANQGATGTVPAVTGTAVTLMTWVRPLDLTAGTTHFICGVMQSNGNTDLALWTQRGNFGTANVVQGNVRINGNLSAVNGSALSVGTWYHVAVTYDGATIRLYLDGVQVATTNVAGSISLGTDFYVAGALAAAGVDTDVRDDDVRYYNEVLDQATIATLKDTPVASEITGTGAVTAPAAQVTGAGSVIVTGTGSVTAAAAQVAGDGAVIIGGSGEIVTPTAIISGSGAVVINGSGSFTAPAAVVSGTESDAKPPAERTLAVPAEARALTVPTDVRVFAVPAEARKLIVER